MDISNATAAGPSYGILDVIMGKTPKEEKAEGKEFEPMLNLIKALEKQKDEDGIVDYIAGRRFCPCCMERYHEWEASPEEDEICDRCKTKLKMRKKK